MSKTNILSKLTLTAKPNKPSSNPQLQRRNKLLTRLNEQREMARCMIEKEDFVVMKDKRITDPATGDRKTVSLPKRVKPWYYEINKQWYFEVRYGNKPIELSKGKAAITVDGIGNLLTTIDLVINAANNGELDTLLDARSYGSKVAS